MRSVNKDKGEKLANYMNATDFVETSAKFGENVEFAFQKLINHILIDG